MSSGTLAASVVRSRNSNSWRIWSATAHEGERPALRVETAVDRQGGDQPHRRAAGVGEAIERPRKVVFEEGFARVLEKGNRFQIIGGVRRRHPEIEPFALFREGDAAHAPAHRFVLRRRKRLRIDDVQAERPPGPRSVGFQKLAHPLRILPEARQIGRQRLAEKEPDRDRLFQIREHRPRAVRKR